MAEAARQRCGGDLLHGSDGLAGTEAGGRAAVDGGAANVVESRDRLRREDEAGLGEGPHRHHLALVVPDGDPVDVVNLGAVSRLAMRIMRQLPQRSVTTVTTNVPGPQLPLYSAGCRMTEVYPYVPLAEQVRIGVAMFSYDGCVYYGVTGDFGTCEDIDALAGGTLDEACKVLRNHIDSHRQRMEAAS